MATYKELLAQQESLARQIEEARTKEISQAVEQARQLVADYGLTVDDIFPSGKKPKATKGTTVAAKYRDPATGATWTGRGKAPKWIQDKNRDDFLI